MKKRLFALLLAVSLVLCLAGCGGSSNAASSASAAKDSSQSAAAPTAAAEEIPAEDSAAETEASAQETVAVEVPDTELPLSDGSETFEVWMGISPAAMNYITSLADNATYQSS